MMTTHEQQALAAAIAAAHDKNILDHLRAVERAVLALLAAEPRRK